MSEEFRLREYGGADYAAVAALWREAFGRLKPEDTPAGLERVVGRNPGLFLLATAGEEVTGTVLGATDGRRGFLYRVAVAPGWRRRGVGRALVAEVERRLWATGVHTIHFRVEADNPGVLAFYARLGFTIDTPAIAGMRKDR
jgi:ribosomal protein S18 acetylase RimI-like enzyme